MSRYSIFHTSHCGSTLMACLLSESIPTVTEPRWSFSLEKYPGKTNTLKYIESNFKEDTLVKFSSQYCCVAPIIAGKKVFLYRTLESHLEKMISNSFLFETNRFYSLFKSRNSINKKIKVDITELTEMNILLSHAFFWVNNYFYISEAEDVLKIESNNFIKNKIETLKHICNFFEITYKQPKELDFDAKRSGLNMNDNSINLEKESLNKFYNEIYPPTNPLMLKNTIFHIEKLFPDIASDMLYDK